MPNKVVSLNSGGSKYSLIEGLKEHIEDIDHIVGLVIWKNNTAQFISTRCSSELMAFSSIVIQSEITSMIMKGKEPL